VDIDIFRLTLERRASKLSASSAANYYNRFRTFLRCAEFFVTKARSSPHANVFSGITLEMIRKSQENVRDRRFTITKLILATFI